MDEYINTWINEFYKDSDGGMNGWMDRQTNG